MEKDDLISRQAAIDALNDLMLSTNVRKLDFEQIGYNHALADGILTIRRVPSAQRKGRWIPHDLENGEKSIDEDCCSVCGERFREIAMTGCEWNFCPNCGADMKGEDDE